MNIILQTERLYLRQFSEADAHLLRELNSQPGVLQYIPEPIPATDEEAKEIIINIILPQYKKNLAGGLCI
jgi:RimJ/RimL family protein N-acetyltransferase